MSVKITKDNTKNFLANIEALASKRVYVGIPGEKSNRSGPINNAQIGYISEHGSPVNNVPARPHLVPGIQAAMPEIVKELRVSAKAAMKLPGTADARLERAGIKAVISVKQKITSQEGFPELKDGTLKARARKGFKGTKALIETGQYLNAINYVVRNK